MTWNYRIIDHGEHLALHEVYYRDGKPSSYTAGPVAFICGKDEGPQDIIRSLAKALNDATNKPVLHLADFAGEE